MKKENYKFIFDLDGTLYQFNIGDKTFMTSLQHDVLRKNTHDFIMQRRSLTQDQTESEYQRIKDKYQGEMSIGVEAEYGIDRYEFFNNVWNMKPELYIQKNTQLSEIMKDLKGNIALLTSAPRIWAINVLKYLEIEDIFEGNIYTGEPNERKPNPIVFQKIADDFDISPENIFSIGDQEHTDILPAKKIGMKTIHISASKNTTADYQAKDIVEVIKILKNNKYI